MKKEVLNPNRKPSVKKAIGSLVAQNASLVIWSCICLLFTVFITPLEDFYLSLDLELWAWVILYLSTATILMIILMFIVRENRYRKAIRSQDLLLSVQHAERVLPLLSRRKRRMRVLDHVHCLLVQKSKKITEQKAETDCQESRRVVRWVYCLERWYVLSKFYIFYKKEVGYKDVHLFVINFSQSEKLLEIVAPRIFQKWNFYEFEKKIQRIASEMASDIKLLEGMLTYEKLHELAKALVTEKYASLFFEDELKKLQIAAESSGQKIPAIHLSVLSQECRKWGLTVLEWRCSPDAEESGY